MAIVLFDARPAVVVVDGRYETPEAPWANLGEPDIRQRLETAIRSVGRLEDDAWAAPFVGTVFVVGPDLVATTVARRGTSGKLSVVFDDGRRIPVSERLALMDERSNYELLRVSLPDELKPLTLSGLAPETLTGSEVAVIGFPASAAGNDPTVMQRIFGVRLDVKRVMPGKVTGLDSGSLQHDCSTTGGCGGAPLIDLATGEVVGIHSGGRYLKSNFAVPATDVAKHVAGARSGRRSPTTRGPRSSHTPRSFEVAAAERDATVTAVAEPPPPDGKPVPEAAPLPTDRPAVPAADWRDAVQGPWKEVLKPNEFRLDTAIRAVGRAISGLPDDKWSGTAFIVGERLALTASFLAQSFTNGSGRDVTIRAGAKPIVDFSEAVEAAPGTAAVRVKAVRFIHPYFHVALLELDQTPAGLTRLELAAQLPADLSSRPVALVSYTPTGKLVVQPGQALQVAELPDDSHVPALAHDCASEPGSAGGPVIDLGTGYVIGVHSHARQGASVKEGFAQPPWELARDPMLWEQTLGFRPDPKPPWLDAWGVAGAVPVKKDLAPAPTNTQWSVDEVPIDWTKEEPRAVESALIANVNGQVALLWAENIGVPLGLIQRDLPPGFLWRELLRTAATAKLLRRFLEYIASQPDCAAIAPNIRIYL
jgi:hypothetical protein